MTHASHLSTRSCSPVANAAGTNPFPPPSGKGGVSPVGQSGWWNFAAASGTHLDLYLYGVIGGWDYSNDQPNDAAQVIATLNQYRNLQTLTVHINSVGGMVSEGLAILNTLRNHPAEVSVEIDAFALSIASIIMLAAAPGKLRMPRNAHIMIHNVSMGAWGNKHELQKAIAVTDQLEQSLIAEYAAKTGKPAEELQALLDAETWFTAQAALDFGLIDQITDAVDLNAAADNIPTNVWENMHTSGLNNMPIDVRAQMSRRLLAVNNAAGTPPPAAATQAPTQTPSAATPTRESLLAELQQAENTRRTDVLAVFQPFGGTSGRFASEAQAALADMGMTADKAREMLLNKLGSESPGSITNGGGAQITDDERDKRIGAAVNALLARGGQAQLEQGNPMAYQSLQDLARSSLETAGVSTRGQHPLNMVGQAFMQSTGDFPVILERTITEAVLMTYRKKALTWKKWCAVGSVSDFRSHERLRLGSFGNLDKLTEGGEYKNKAIPDGEKESVSIGTKGNIISITREAIINDDLGYFMRMATMLGGAAARTVEADAYTYLLSNPKLKDGKPIVHASRGNLQTAAAMSEDSLDKMRQAMASMKDISGNDELDIIPYLLMVNAAQKLTADKWMKSATLPGQDNPAIMNGVSGMAEVLATSRLSSINKGFYLFADPSDSPVIEVNFLFGNEEPFIDTQDGWRIDGTEMKVRLDYGVGAVDYRGIQFNPGA